MPHAAVAVDDLSSLFGGVRLDDAPIPRFSPAPCPAEWGVEPAAPRPRTRPRTAAPTEWGDPPPPRPRTRRPRTGLPVPAFGVPERLGAWRSDLVHVVEGERGDVAGTSSDAGGVANAPVANASVVNCSVTDGVGGFKPESSKYPEMFKVRQCRDGDACVRAGIEADCFDFHPSANDRRRQNTDSYSPRMCSHIAQPGGCKMAGRCGRAHNMWETRFHPEKFQKDLCRHHLRGGCTKRWCPFRHEMSAVVRETANNLNALEGDDILQLLQNISLEKRQLVRSMIVRVNGNGGPASAVQKRHCGWRLEGFVPNGREEQKVKFLTARVDGLKHLLRDADQKSLSTILKTSSLRDMMSSARKLAEELRERGRVDNVSRGAEVHRLVRAVCAGTNWSCHSEEGDNPFLVTPENQNDAITSLTRLVELFTPSTA